MIPCTQPYYKWHPDFDLQIFQRLSLFERGMIETLRCWSLTYGGIPDDENELRLIARSCFISFRKFSKFFEKLQSYFILRGGKYWFQPDEDSRLEAAETSAKLHIAGQKGAMKRWSTRNEMQQELPMEVNGQTTGQAISHPSGQTTGQAIEKKWQAQAKAKLPTREVPATASSVLGNPHEPESTKEAAAGPPPVEIRRTMPQSYGYEVMHRCQELGISPPDQKFIARLFEHAPNIPPAKLPRFPGQNSAGLWLSKSEAEIGLEIDSAAIRKSPQQAEHDAQTALINKLAWGR